MKGVAKFTKKKQLSTKKMIKISDMVENGIYIIHARNAWIGIWRSEDKAFIIRRCKFNSIFPFPEYHWDIGPPHGTAKPLKFLDRLMSHESPDLDELYSLSEKHDDEYEQLICELNLTDI